MHDKYCPRCGKFHEHCRCTVDPCDNVPCGTPHNMNCEPSYRNSYQPNKVPSPPCPVVPPKVPPIHYVPGLSPYENMAHVIEHVRIVDGTVNSMIDRACGTYAKLERISREDGAYYYRPEVWREDGYYTEEGCPYQVIHKAACDRRGRPIDISLKLAYGNTTNSEITEDFFNASHQEIAQVLIPAADYTARADNPEGYTEGWTGLATYRGAPIPTDDKRGKFTVGFSQRGTLRIYDNSTPRAQLRRDGIRDAMGCAWPIIRSGVIEEAIIGAESGNEVANRQQQRCVMGQNRKTREVFILTCGGYDVPGMTSKACAEVLLSYGVDEAVELTLANNTTGMYKGFFLNVPPEAKVPESYAFWVISKKKEYRTRSNWEIGRLVQKWAYCMWLNKLNAIQIGLIWKEIEDIKDRLDQIEATLENHEDRLVTIEAQIVDIYEKIAALDERVTSLEARMTEVEDRVTSLEGRMTDAENRITLLEGRVTDLEGEIVRIDGELDDLREALAQEVLDRIAGDDALREQIEKEIADRIAAIADLQAQIDVHTEQITQLRMDLTALEATVQSHYELFTQLINDLRNDFTNLEQRQAALEAQMDSLDKAVTELIQAMAEIEIALNNLKVLVNQIATRVTELEEWRVEIDATIENHETRITALEEWKVTVDEAIEAINISITAINNTITEINNTITDIQATLENHEERITALEAIEIPSVIDQKIKYYEEGGTVTGAELPWGTPGEIGNTGVTSIVWTVICTASDLKVDIFLSMDISAVGPLPAVSGENNTFFRVTIPKEFRVWSDLGTFNVIPMIPQDNGSLVRRNHTVQNISASLSRSGTTLNPTMTVRCFPQFSNDDTSIYNGRYQCHWSYVPNYAIDGRERANLEEVEVITE